MRARVEKPARGLSGSPSTQFALLLVAGVALWSTSFRGAFQFDDFGAILRSGWVGAPPPSAVDAIRSIRPLTGLTFVLERRLFGTEPAGYHLLSVALHLASTLLVWRIGRRLLRAEPRAPAPLALFCALLFLVHPLATEAVTYLSGRASLLAASLSLLAVERWLAWREVAGRGERAPSCAWGSLAAFALALFAKETAAVVPLALALVDLHSARRDDEPAARLSIRAFLPHLAVLALFLSVAASRPVYQRLLAHSLALRTPAENLAVQPRVAAEALALWFEPWRLNLDHDLRVERVEGEAPAWLLAIELAVLAVGALIATRRGSLVGFGCAWFLVHLLPTCSLVARNDLLSERNLYLPSVGICFACAALLAEARGATGALAAAAAVVLLLALGVATARRNALYADPVALWRDTVAKSPAKARPHANLAWSLELAGDLDGAIHEYRVAVRLEPDYAPTRESLVRAWERKLLAATETPRVEQLSPPRSPPAE